MTKICLSASNNRKTAELVLIKSLNLEVQLTFVEVFQFDEIESNDQFTGKILRVSAGL
jgi:hypothetical protein